ncbi:MAG: alpha/beta hydrolase [Gemmatimonadales bacterium]
MRPRVLLLPGLYDSGPDHWHSHWERADPTFLRVVQRDWTTPARHDWVQTLDNEIAAAGPEVILAAHSTACALVAFWSVETGGRVGGALLVGPSDTEAASYPHGPVGWQPMPLERLPFPTLVVASEDDEYVSLHRARTFAKAWGSQFRNIGRAGHINSASGLGDWPAGRTMLTELRDRTGSAEMSAR